MASDEPHIFTASDGKHPWKRARDLLVANPHMSREEKMELIKATRHKMNTLHDYRKQTETQKSAYKQLADVAVPLQLELPQRLQHYKDVSKHKPKFENHHMQKMANDPNVLSGLICDKINDHGKQEMRFITLTQKVIFVLHPKELTHPKRRIFTVNIEGIIQDPKHPTQLGLKCNQFDYDLYVNVLDEHMKDHFVGSLISAITRAGRRLKMWECSPVIKFIRLSKKDIGKSVYLPLKKGPYDHLGYSSNQRITEQISARGSYSVFLSCNLIWPKGHKLIVSECSVMELDTDESIIRHYEVTYFKYLIYEPADPHFFSFTTRDPYSPPWSFGCANVEQLNEYFKLNRPDLERVTYQQHQDKKAADDIRPVYDVDIEKEQQHTTAEVERRHAEELKQLDMDLYAKRRQEVNREVASTQETLAQLAKDRDNQIVQQAQEAQNEFQVQREKDADTAISKLEELNAKLAELQRHQAEESRKEADKEAEREKQRVKARKQTAKHKSSIRPSTLADKIIDGIDKLSRAEQSHAEQQNEKMRQIRDLEFQIERKFQDDDAQLVNKVQEVTAQLNEVNDAIAKEEKATKEIEKKMLAEVEERRRKREQNLEREQNLIKKVEDEMKEYDEGLPDKEEAIPQILEHFVQKRLHEELRTTEAQKEGERVKVLETKVAELRQEAEEEKKEAERQEKALQDAKAQLDAIKDKQSLADEKEAFLHKLQVVEQLKKQAEEFEEELKQAKEANHKAVSVSVASAAGDKKIQQDIREAEKTLKHLEKEVQKERKSKKNNKAPKAKNDALVSKVKELEEKEAATEKEIQETTKACKKLEKEATHLKSELDEKKEELAALRTIMEASPKDNTASSGTGPSPEQIEKLRDKMLKEIKRSNTVYSKLQHTISSKERLEGDEHVQRAYIMAVEEMKLEKILLIKLHQRHRDSTTTHSSTKPIAVAPKPASPPLTPTQQPLESSSSPSTPRLSSGKSKDKSPASSHSNSSRSSKKSKRSLLSSGSSSHASTTAMTKKSKRRNSSSPLSSPSKPSSRGSVSKATRSSTTANLRRQNDSPSSSSRSHSSPSSSSSSSRAYSSPSISSSSSSAHSSPSSSQQSHTPPSVTTLTTTSWHTILTAMPTTLTTSNHASSSSSSVGASTATSTNSDPTMAYQQTGWMRLSNSAPLSSTVGSELSFDEATTLSTPTSSPSNGDSRQSATSGSSQRELIDSIFADELRTEKLLFERSLWIDKMQFSVYRTACYHVNATRNIVTAHAPTNSLVLCNTLLHASITTWKLKTTTGFLKCGVAAYHCTTKFITAGGATSWVLTACGGVMHEEKIQKLLPPLQSGDIVTVQLDLTEPNGRLLFGVNDQPLTLGVSNIERQSAPFVPIVELYEQGDECEIIQFNTQ